MSPTERARRTVEQFFGLQADGPSRRLTFPEIKSALARLRSRLPFWERLALCFLIDPSRGDRLVMPNWLLDECELEAGARPRWIKGSDLIDEVLVLRERPRHAPDAAEAGQTAAAPLGATCSACAAANLQHFFRSRAAGTILCPECFPASARHP